MRLYPRTPLGERALRGELDDGLQPKGARDLSLPVFYTSPALGKDPEGMVRELAGGDERFLLLAGPAEEGAYNYADDEALCEAIKKGARGAYWDIIRRRMRGEI